MVALPAQAGGVASAAARVLLERKNRTDWSNRQLNESLGWSRNTVDRYLHGEGVMPLDAFYCLSCCGYLRRTSKCGDRVTPRQRVAHLVQSGTGTGTGTGTVRFMGSPALAAAVFGAGLVAAVLGMVISIATARRRRLFASGVGLRVDGGLVVLVTGLVVTILGAGDLAFLLLTA